VGRAQTSVVNEQMLFGQEIASPTYSSTKYGSARDEVRKSLSKAATFAPRWSRNGAYICPPGSSQKLFISDIHW